MMRNMIILLIAILPVFLIAFYVYKKDREKESKKLLIRMFIFGMLICIPAVFIEIYIGGLFGDEETMGLVKMFFYVVISIAMVEEICKWFVVYKFGYNNREFDHIYDAIVYSVFVALGFAAFENLFYAFDGGITTALLRAITAVPGHAIDAVIMGNYLGLAKKNSMSGNKKEAIKLGILSIIAPTIIHGIYDYCLFTRRMIFLGIFLVFLIATYIYGIKKIKKISAITTNLDNTIDNYVPEIKESKINKKDKSKKIQVKNEEMNTTIEAQPSNTNFLDPNSKFCPVCGKPYRDEKKCGRCGADLTFNS